MVTFRMVIQAEGIESLGGSGALHLGGGGSGKLAGGDQQPSG
jgi:hypothetical protein